MKRELRQIHMLNTYDPKLALEVTVEEKGNAIPSLMFLTEKQEGTIKAQNCADGRF